MANFFTDNQDIQFHLRNLDLARLVSYKEDGFGYAKTFKEAPSDLADALDNYQSVLEVIGSIAGERIALRAAEVDRIGATFKDHQVTYAPGTSEAIELLKQAELLGFTLDRTYGGLNMPKTIYSMAVEIISRADASLMNLFGLQEIADTIYHFGTPEQRNKYLPMFSKGEVLGAMALTEPDAGSDLQAVMLKAVENNGQWKLNGVKRFITNGCADIILVMARSEAGTRGGKGLSLFIYERDENVTIRRIEEKMGIHGSPTCELQFNQASAELLGKRKLGLIKYTMSLMNGARLGIAAQSIGIAEAAYREAKKYANERIQSKKKIREFAAVYEMLTQMQTEIEAGRALLYETSRMVDLKEGIEAQIAKYPEQQAELKDELRKYTKYTGFFTPLVKGYASEMVNRVCYQAIQIHGGVGFTCDFNVERHYRDARITSIYEGTTQLQVVAALSGVITGIVFDWFDECQSQHNFSANASLFEKAFNARGLLKQSVDYVKEKGDSQYQEYHARRLVEMATDVVFCYLLCIGASQVQRKVAVAQVFIESAFRRCEYYKNLVLSDDFSVIDHHDEICFGDD